MGFRIDPVDEKGVFDHDFYSSEDYSLYVKKLEQYLKEEGFEHKDDQFCINFLNHAWVCKFSTTFNPDNTKKRKRKKNEDEN